ncbi:hypothetical protein KBD69_02625 [Candidatus Woesebacteria bacterium]|nr:hypothetical protein [Candidatus Woesebacteria bacterium]
MGIRGYFGYAQKAYKELLPAVHPMKYGVDPVHQLAEIISRKRFERDDFKVAVFVCPLFLIDEKKLAAGFSSAITDVAVGTIDAFPRYKHKFDKAIALIREIKSVLMGALPVHIELILGDTGLPNGELLGRKHNLNIMLSDNLLEYGQYLLRKDRSIFNASDHYMISELTAQYRVGDFAQKGSDLVEDGKIMRSGDIQFGHLNKDVARKTYDEARHKRGRGESEYESYGFHLNYGLAGLALRSRGVDLIIGTDPETSYMNYLYHAFMDPKDLMIVVPRENIV